IDAAEASVRGPSGEPHGTLRMTVPEAFGRHVVLPVVQRFLETWPEVRVDIDVTDRAANLVEEGFDLAFRLGDRVRADPGLISRIIARYPVGLVAAPDYLRVRNKPQTPEDLLHHETLLFRGRGGVQPWRYRDGGTRWVRLPVRGRLQMSSGTALRDAAVAGLGVAFLPSFVVKDDVAAGRLARVLPDLDLGEAVIAALYPSRRLLPPRVRRFIDLVFETTSDAPTNPRSS
ncbi:MAG: substrate binding domain-containing protein, partial [Myxococcota bacterium]